MRLQTTLLGLLLGLLVSGSVFAKPLELDLQQAVRTALENNPSWLLTQDEVAVADRRQAYDAETRPTLSFSGTLLDYSSRDDRYPTVQLTGRLDLTDNSRLELTAPLRLSDDGVRMRPGISYTQDLFVPVPAERPVQPSSEPEQVLFTQRQRLVLDVGIAYYEVLRSLHEQTVLERELDLAKLQAQKTRELERPEAEILRADNHVDEAQVSLQRAEDALDDAQRELRTILGTDSASFLLEEAVDFAPFAVDLAAWQAEAAARHPQVLEAEYRLAVAEANLADYDSDHGFDVSLSAIYQERTASSDTNYELRASVTVRRSLYPEDPVRRSELELAAAKAELALEQAVAGARREVEVAYRQVTNIEDRVRTLEQRVTDAHESLVQEERRFEAGLSTSFDVFELQLLVDTLGYDWLHAKYDHAVAVARLYMASSQVIPW